MPLDIGRISHDPENETFNLKSFGHLTTGTATVPVHWLRYFSHRPERKRATGSSLERESIMEFKKSRTTSVYLMRGVGVPEV